MKKRIASAGIKEVAMVLGIIAIIFVCAVPALVSKYMETQTVVKLKKGYSTLIGAYNLDVMEHDELDAYSDKNYFENFSKYLKIAKNCRTGKNLGCFGEGKYKKLSGEDFIDFDGDKEYYKMVLSDGLAIAINRTREYEDSIGEVWVDVTGPNKPNQLGVDTFVFTVDKHGKLDPWCDLSGLKLSDTDCNVYNEGTCCSAWVIRYQNLQYRNCDDLVWDGKHECKK